MFTGLILLCSVLTGECRTLDSGLTYGTREACLRSFVEEGREYALAQLEDHERLADWACFEW